jgi:hypothetical protein
MYLQQHCQYLTKKAVYNVVDINVPDNDWYFKWLVPITLPLTCVFSSDGMLVDMIPGIAKETFLYTDLAIKEKSATDYHCPNSFNLSKERLIPLLDNILKQKLNLDQHIFLSAELDNLIDSLHYPYPYYLKMTGELMRNDTVAAKNTAKSLIDIENSYYLETFNNEFIIAKRLLNPDFNVEDEPHIRIDRNIINLSNCVVNKKVPIDVVIHNDGNKPLKISDIQMSCSCVKLASNSKEFIIGSKDSTIVRFNFISDIEGALSRDIFIFSNAINSPILNINIQADSRIDNKLNVDKK